MEAHENDVICLSLQDRFVDFRTVGVAILIHQGKNTDIDTFLLGRRALGSGVKKVLLNACIGLVKAKGKPL